MLVDALAARVIRDPGSLDVVVASNLFADILTDLAAAIAGGLGMAASANLSPGSGEPALFESVVHGSAPDIAGQGLANPLAAIWSAVLMLEHLGEQEAAGRLMRAIEHVCAYGPKTRDIGTGTQRPPRSGIAIVAAVTAEQFALNQLGGTRWPSRPTAGSTRSS